MDYEAVDNDSSEEIMSNKEIELVEIKCRREMGLDCEDYIFNYMYKYYLNSRPAWEALKPAVHLDNK